MPLYLDEANTAEDMIRALKQHGRMAIRFPVWKASDEK